MKPFRTLDDVDVKGKRVLLRVDLNVPTDNGRVTDTTRLNASRRRLRKFPAKAAR
jgi:phosphoglycerate kinase